MKNFIRELIDFFQAMLKSRVGVYTAQASFFMVLSIFPLIMLIMTLIGFTDISQEVLIKFATDFTPNIIDDLVMQIIDELYANASGTIVSITAIAVIWSASKGVSAIITGMYEIFHHDKHSNYIINRLLSMVYVIIFVIILVFALVILVFGNRILSAFLNRFEFMSHLTIIVLALRSLLSVLILSLLFIAIYKTARNKDYKFKDYVPGALFSSAGWMLFSYAFSIYIDNFSNYSYMYGSLTTVILLMLWLYFCMYIMFIGAHIVVYFKKLSYEQD